MVLNPELRGKAVAVCGSTEDRHGIVLAKSELAKKAGVNPDVLFLVLSHNFILSVVTCFCITLTTLFVYVK